MRNNSRLIHFSDALAGALPLGSVSGRNPGLACSSEVGRAILGAALKIRIRHGLRPRAFGPVPFAVFFLGKGLPVKITPCQSEKQMWAMVQPMHIRVETRMVCFAFLFLCLVLLVR